MIVSAFTGNANVHSLQQFDLVFVLFLEILLARVALLSFIRLFCGILWFFHNPVVWKLRKRLIYGHTKAYGSNRAVVKQLARPVEVWFSVSPC